ncbi:MAG: arsenate reductase ArsC [Spirochaetota bacterium]
MKKNRIKKERVLFICTHNSARSQIAEGLMNSLYGHRYEAFSAGTEKTAVNPHAVEVMKRAGIDISHHRSKSIEEFGGEHFDYVVTVCDSARENCPFFPGKKLLHKTFEDPSEAAGDCERVVQVFERVRDEIRTWLEETFGKEG